MHIDNVDMQEIRKQVVGRFGKELMIETGVTFQQLMDAIVFMRGLGWTLKARVSLRPVQGENRSLLVHTELTPMLGPLEPGKEVFVKAFRAAVDAIRRGEDSNGAATH